jgi:hypothetical protein
LLYWSPCRLATWPIIIPIPNTVVVHAGVACLTDELPFTQCTTETVLFPN